MKLKKAIIVAVVALSLQSCYVHTYTVGMGPQTGEMMRKKQHNFIGGLISGDTPTQKEICNEELENYQISNRFRFIDMILSSLTAGIYTPTTITVIK